MGLSLMADHRLEDGIIDRNRRTPLLLQGVDFCLGTNLSHLR